MTHAGFEHATRGLVDHDVAQLDPETGVKWIANRDYRTTDGSVVDGFSAGSYTGHSMFRDCLAALTGRTSRDYWKGDINDAPFAELINFSDCEGAIGHEAAADLLADFREFEVQFMAANGEDSRDAIRYRAWMTALEIAADHGIVVFH